jgi:hypothetical protein
LREILDVSLNVSLRCFHSVTVKYAINIPFNLFFQEYGTIDFHDRGEQWFSVFKGDKLGKNWRKNERLTTGR